MLVCLQALRASAVSMLLSCFIHLITNNNLLCLKPLLGHSPCEWLLSMHVATSSFRMRFSIVPLCFLFGSQVGWPGKTQMLTDANCNCARPAAITTWRSQHDMRYNKVSIHWLHSAGLDTWRRGAPSSNMST